MDTLRKGSQIDMDMQVAALKQALRSVRRVRETGKRAAIHEEGSFVEKAGDWGKRNLLKEKGAHILYNLEPKQGEP